MNDEMVSTYKIESGNVIHLVLTQHVPLADIESESEDSTDNPLNEAVETLTSIASNSTLNKNRSARCP